MAADSAQKAHHDMSLFRPPIHRAANAVLDRSLFTKVVNISAARVFENRKIGLLRDGLMKHKDLLRLEKFTSIQPDPDQARAAKDGKCLLLKPEVKFDDPSTWSPFLHEAAQREEVKVIPYELKLDYNFWSYLDIISSILPEDAHGEIPVGFSIVGHVAHVNLREQYLPYKKLIGQVLLDKNPMIKTVINKTDDVGDTSEYRTFSYEVLAGEDNMNVEAKEQDCLFRFNWSKVYWNTRLNTEHRRLVEAFQPGEVVVDVMAGVGPFAVPAGKKGVFVWANDLNPDSFASMQDAVKRNKVEKYVRPFCDDGHKFIPRAADDVLRLAREKQNFIKLPPKIPRSKRHERPPSPTIITIPQTVSHYVMNLPATAIEFLGSFNGLYEGQEALFEPHTQNKLPMIHVHCFSTKDDDYAPAHRDICERITKELDYEIKPTDEELSIYDVRDVAPHKRMFCASFRLPAEVAFRKRR